MEKKMEWKDLPERALENMKWLGNFGPTMSVADKLIKGFMHDEDGGGKVYLSSSELMELSEDFVVVAKFLEERAAAGN